MLAPLPKSDKMQASDIHEELEAIASVFLPEWRGAETEGEFGQALLKIIARLGEHVTTRIDKTPWRDAVAFFDSLDIPVQSPRPSSAPLVFLLGDKFNAPVFAPAGVQVGAKAEDGELLFESLEAVNLTPARLEFIAAVDSDKDSIELPAPGFLELEPPEGPLPTFFAASFAEKESQTIQIEPFEDLNSGDQIKIAESVYRLEEGQDGLFTLMDPLDTDIVERTEIHKVLNFEAFNNRNLQEHILYIGHSELLNLEQETAIILDIAPQSLVASLTSEPVEWQLYGVENDDPPAWHVLENLHVSGLIALRKNENIKSEKTEVNRIKSFWIRCVFNDTGPAGSFDTRLASIEMNIKILSDDMKKKSINTGEFSTLEDDEAFKSITHAFHNNVPIPLEPELTPFGPEPLRFDTFSISAPEIFSKKGVDVKLSILLNNAETSGGAKLAWEYFNGNGWQSLKLNNDPQDKILNFLIDSGDINFTVPDDIENGFVAGIEGYWIRARLIGGDYGRPSYEVEFSLPSDDDTPEETFLIESISIDPSTITPPRLNRIDISIETTSPVQPEVVLSQNNLDYFNHTQATKEQHASFALHQNARDINGYLTHTNETKASNNVLYFGFNKPFDIRPLSMFVDAEEQEKNVDLDFEVLARDDWQKVNAIDETAGFHRRGFSQIFIDFKPRLARLFGQESYWLRVRPHQSDIHNWAPKLRGVFINAVQAEQAKTIKNEVLGSSAGEPNLKAMLSNQPVLPNSMELRIKESLSDEEREMLLSDTDDLPDHKLPVRNFEEPSLQGDWVLWSQVDSFIGHGPEDRVCRLDPVTGEIEFGNDRQGRIPPAGSGHIRAIHYQTGGGILGNVNAYSITALKSGVEGVESVANPIQAAGGSDAPTIEEQIAQAPARLRRAGLAMTPGDMEALAVATSPDLVRARCLFPVAPGDPIQVAIVMRNGERCPKPTLAEQDALARLIRTQSWGGLRRDDIRVGAPHYVPLELTLRIRPDANENAAKLEKAATDRMRQLLHPVDGGPGGAGWPFGRRLWKSDILRALAELASFDSVLELDFRSGGQGADFERMAELAMICAHEEDIRVTVEPTDEES